MERITNIVKVGVTLPFAVFSFGVASLWHNYSLDPVVIENGKTPILLIHGSDSNQQQWLYFRQFMQGESVGHIFAVNLNKKPVKNDHNRDVLDYANAIHEKLICMKKLYKEAGYDLDQVILVGNSMGGLVAAAYYIAENIKDHFQVNAVISISSPWKGSRIADIFCDKNKFPEKYFCRSSTDRDDLVTKFMERATRNDLPIYNYGSHLDLLVTAESSTLPISTDNILLDDRNDHITTMLDSELARHVRDEWAAKHTQDLVQIKVDEEEEQKEEELLSPPLD